MPSWMMPSQGARRRVDAWPAKMYGLGHDANTKGEDLMQALSKLAESSIKAIRPLLCFLDVKMPGMSGHEILRWIRAQPALDSVPMVVLSSSEHPEDIKQAIQNGAHCYLTKYPQPAVLKEVVGDAGRFALGAPAGECFRIPENQLLVRCRRLNDAVA